MTSTLAFSVLTATHECEGEWQLPEHRSTITCPGMTFNTDPVCPGVSGTGSWTSVGRGWHRTMALHTLTWCEGEQVEEGTYLTGIESMLPKASSNSSRQKRKTIRDHIFSAVFGTKRCGVLFHPAGAVSHLRRKLRYCRPPLLLRSRTRDDLAAAAAAGDSQMPRARRRCFFSPSCRPVTLLCILYNVGGARLLTQSSASCPAYFLLATASSAASLSFSGPFLSDSPCSLHSRLRLAEVVEAAAAAAYRHDILVVDLARGYLETA